MGSAMTCARARAPIDVATEFVEPTGASVTTGGCCGDGEVPLIRMP
jgi:hypothetical protein